MPIAIAIVSSHCLITTSFSLVSLAMSPADDVGELSLESGELEPEEGECEQVQNLTDFTMMTDP